jgi:hypothetical protein
MENRIFFSDLDDLSRALRIISKSIGRDWNRLYWQLPFHPARGQEELSKDIKHIDEKYQRGHVYQVKISCEFMELLIKFCVGSSKRCIE